MPGANKKIIKIINQLSDLDLADNFVLVPADSKLDYIFWVTDNFGQDLEIKPIIQIGDRAQANIYYCYLGKYNVKIALEYHLASQAQVNHQVVFLASEQQHFSFQEKYIFQGQQTFGRFTIRGLVQDSAQVICDGNINIAPGAQKTDAYLDMQAVIMDRSARAEMIPGLQIEANDVKASHSAKVSMLDEEQLFYLRSRGLNTDQAKNFFVTGMFADLLDKMPDEQIKKDILKIINQKLHGEH